MLQLYVELYLMGLQDVATTPVAETVDLASMSVEDSYDGPHLEGKELCVPAPAPIAFKVVASSH